MECELWLMETKAWICELFSRPGRLWTLVARERVVGSEPLLSGLTSWPQTHSEAKVKQMVTEFRFLRPTAGGLLMLGSRRPCDDDIRLPHGFGLPSPNTG